jgi:hypothetical protein
MQDMYYNENPQEESSLQQGINPNIYNAFGGLVRKHAIGSFLNPNNPDSINQLPIYDPDFEGDPEMPDVVMNN